MDRFQTARLILIPLAYQTLQHLLIDPDKAALELQLSLVPGLVNPPVDRAIQSKLAKMRTADPAQHPWFTYWLVVIPEENKGVGMAGFKGIPNAEGVVEIGYGIHPDYQNRGYITEVVQALVDWAFAQTACRKVTAETRRDNPASQRVLEKSGFTIFRESIDEFWWQKTRSV